MTGAKAQLLTAICKMKYTREDYERFLLAEIDAQKNEYQDLVSTRALVLKARGEIFVGRYLSVQGDGMLIFKVRNSDSMPRKNSYWTACYFTDEMGSYKNWGTLSWAELREDYQRRYSDAYCAWVSKSDNPDFCLIGIKGITLDFAGLLEEDKPIIAFGPKDPPLKYLLNLRELCLDSSSSEVNKVLDMDMVKDEWSPTILDSQADFILTAQQEAQSGSVIAVQGPPGTGKTHRIAQYAASLLEEGRSVLVVALTNRALMEVAEKESLEHFLKAGHISKTSLTVDERKELPELQDVIDNQCNSAQRHLTLATFYVSSGWALESEDPPFDYIIMDEASQALLPMIAATFKLGQKVMLIGDQNQLSPIVELSEDLIRRYSWQQMIDGFDSACKYFEMKSFMLSDSYRLPERAVNSTGVFYNNRLRSVSIEQSVPSLVSFVNKKGGPVLIPVTMEVGKKAPTEAFDTIFGMTKSLLTENPKYKIAILSKFRETTRKLHEFFVKNWNSDDFPVNLKIETVDRVQGTTEDFCFFLIPNASFQYSVERPLFNVATSRARYNTFIVIDEVLLKMNMPEEVRNYFLSIK